MTRELIEDIREIVLPFLRNVLSKTNYENLGKSDAEEFTRDFNEILDLAIKALEQEPKTGHWNDIPKYKDIAWQCSECKHFTTMKHNYCPKCGAKMVEPQESEDT